MKPNCRYEWMKNIPPAATKTKYLVVLTAWVLWQRERKRESGRVAHQRSTRRYSNNNKNVWHLTTIFIYGINMFAYEYSYVYHMEMFVCVSPSCGSTCGYTSIYVWMWLVYAWIHIYKYLVTWTQRIMLIA